jgi:hypothetical protein
MNGECPLSGAKLTCLLTDRKAERPEQVSENQAVKRTHAPKPVRRHFCLESIAEANVRGMSALGHKRTWRLRCKISLRARSGHQRQHEQSCGAALPRFCCVKNARRQRRLARLRLLFRRQRAPRQVERDLHVSHSLWAEVPNFSDHERPRGNPWSC